MHDESLIQAPLGKQSTYISEYQANLLFPIPRQIKRSEIGIYAELPFHGADFWNAFELSWLNSKGKPVVATAIFTFPADTPNIIESKSFKLYLNSFNNSSFASFNAVSETLERDLSAAAGATICVRLFPLQQTNALITPHFQGICLDDQDIACDTYMIEPNFLTTAGHHVTETVYSDLLKSNCLVTGQPDWGSVEITYSGSQIDHAGLLRYLVSFRNHNEFHEQCVERIYTDIMRLCAPTELCVYARYTRRGGLDINPYRANYPIEVSNGRLIRQ